MADTNTTNKTAVVAALTFGTGLYFVKKFFDKYGRKDPTTGKALHDATMRDSYSQQPVHDKYGNIVGMKGVEPWESDLLQWALVSDTSGLQVHDATSMDEFYATHPNSVVGLGEVQAIYGQQFAQMEADQELLKLHPPPMKEIPNIGQYTYAPAGVEAYYKELVRVHGKGWENYVDENGDFDQAGFDSFYGKY